MGRPALRAWRTSSTPAADDRRHRCTGQPTEATSSQMVCSATVSLVTGLPGSPSREANGPACITPPRDRKGSTGFSHTV